MSATAVETRKYQLFIDGQWVDAILMSVLEDEWREHRGHPTG